MQSCFFCVRGALVPINHPNASFLYQNALWAQIETSNNSVKTCASWGPSRYDTVCYRVNKVLSSRERGLMFSIIIAAWSWTCW